MGRRIAAAARGVRDVRSGRRRARRPGGSRRSVPGARRDDGAAGRGRRGPPTLRRPGAGPAGARGRGLHRLPARRPRPRRGDGGPAVPRPGRPAGGQPDRPARRAARAGRLARTGPPVAAGRPAGGGAHRPQSADATGRPSGGLDAPAAGRPGRRPGRGDGNRAGAVRTPGRAGAGRNGGSDSRGGRRSLQRRPGAGGGGLRRRRRARPGAALAGGGRSSRPGARRRGRSRAGSRARVRGAHRRPGRGDRLAPLRLRHRSGPGRRPDGVAARRDRCALARRVRRTAAGADRGAEPDRPGKPADGRRGGAANARRAAVPAAAAGAAGGHRPVDRALCVAIGRPVRRRPAAGRALAQPRTPRRRRRVRLLPAGRPAGVRYVVGDLSLAAAGPSRGSAARVRARRRARTLVRSGRHPPARPRVGRAGPQDAGAAGAGPCLGRRAVDDGGARGVGRLQAAANAAQFAAPGPDGGQPPLDGPGRRLRGEADPRHGGREQQRSRGRRARGACGRRRRGHGRAPRGRRSPARPSHRRVVRPRERRRRRTEALAALGRRRRRRTVLWHPLPGRSRPDALLRQGQPDRRPGPRAAGARRTDAVLRPSTRQTRRLSGSHSEAATPSLSYVVPTIGVPAHLAKCLESIYRDGGRLDSPPELVVVWQAPLAGDGGGAAALKELCRRLDAARPGAIDGAPRIVELPRPAGFARAVNDGIAVSTGDWVALVNDDVALEAGWARRLLEAVAAGSGVAAVQGVNVGAGGDEGDDDRDGARIDGAGLAWNRRWQAVQLGRGEPASGAGQTAGPSTGPRRPRPAGAPAPPV
ncbi:MAG: glycosyltransferase, partial [Holophagales bacterium]|nr:glycosyltransferase [Holophagales bacterium]